MILRKRHLLNLRTRLAGPESSDLIAPSFFWYLTFGTDNKRASRFAACIPFTILLNFIDLVSVSLRARFVGRGASGFVLASFPGDFPSLGPLLSELSAALTSPPVGAATCCAVVDESTSATPIGDSDRGASGVVE